MRPLQNDALNRAAKARKQIAKRHPGAPLSDIAKALLAQFLNPATAPHLTGLLDRKADTFVRRCLLTREFNVPSSPDGDDQTMEIVVKPDFVQFLGVASTATQTATTSYSCGGPFRIGVDPIFGLSIPTLPATIDASTHSSALLYGGSPPTADGLEKPLRFLQTQGGGLGVLTAPDGKVLFSDEFGTIDLGPSAGTHTYKINVCAVCDAAVNVGDVSWIRVQQSADQVSWSSAGSKDVTSPSYSEIFNFDGNLTARYFRIVYEMGQNTVTGRNLTNMSVELTLTGQVPHQYDYDSVPDLQTLCGMSGGGRIYAYVLWVQYLGTDFTNAGAAAGTSMPYRSFINHGGTWDYDDLAQLNDVYLGEAKKGLFGFYIPKGPLSMDFYGWGNAPPNPNVLVCAMKGLSPSSAYRISVYGLYECESVRLVTGPEARVPHEDDLQAALTVLSAALPCAFTENPLHEDVINGVKKAASYIWDHRDGILAGIGTAAKIGAAALPLLL